jgi:hypothetical protein
LADLFLAHKRSRVSHKGVGGLKHERSHHFVVFVRQNVAVVNVPGELNQLFFRNIKIGIGLLGFVVLSLGPSDS